MPVLVQAAGVYWDCNYASRFDFFFGRNGGHIGPNTYNEYPDLKNRHGRDVALEILRFRWAHIKTLLEVAEEENLLASSQARLLIDYDVFFHRHHFEEAKSQLKEFRHEVPEDIHESFHVVDQEQDIEVSDTPPTNNRLI